MGIQLSASRAFAALKWSNLFQSPMNPKGLIAARYNRSLNRFEISWVLRCSSKAPCLPDERNNSENHIVKRKLLLQNCKARFDCTMLRNTTRGTEPVSMSSTKRKYLHAYQTVPAFTSSPESTSISKRNLWEDPTSPKNGFAASWRKKLKHIETYWKAFTRDGDFRNFIHVHRNISTESAFPRCEHNANTVFIHIYIYTCTNIHICTHALYKIGSGALMEVMNSWVVLPLS